MITLHRLGHAEQEIHVNPDLIVTIEANPDTVITLANGSKLLVSEDPVRVAEAVRHYRVVILAGALRERQEPEPQLAPEGVSTEADGASSESSPDPLPAPIPLRLAQEPGL